MFNYNNNNKHAKVEYQIKYFFNKQLTDHKQKKTQNTTATESMSMMK